MIEPDGDRAWSLPSGFFSTKSAHIPASDGHQTLLNQEFSMLDDTLKTQLGAYLGV